MTTLSFKDAAIKILQETKRPMTAPEICQVALERQLIKTLGKTPEASMGAQIYTDINEKGDQSSFIKVGRGMFALTSNSDKEKSPEQIILEYNRAQKAVLKERLMNMDPFIFEHLVGDLLEKLGYENVEVTKRSGDGGIDVKADLTVYGLTNVKTAVQVKRYAHNVSDSVVRELRGAAEVDQRGLIITTSNFTRAAMEEACAKNKTPISLVDGEKLITLLIDKQIGIKRVQKELVSIDEEYFNSLEGEDVGCTTDKKRALWPLPGGIDRYYETLLSVLTTLQSKPMPKKKIIEWFKKNFENVNSDRTVSSYINIVFMNLGLIQLVKNDYRLTAIADDFIRNPSKDALFEIMRNHIFGIDETMSLLENSDKPISESELNDYLTENYNVNWTTNAQSSFRLQWLWNLEKIKKNEDGKYMLASTSDK